MASSSNPIKSFKFNLSSGKSDINIPVGNKDNKIVIVAYVGQSDDKVLGCKAMTADQIIGKTIFNTQNPPTINANNLTIIEGYYDSPSHVVYLHLRSIYDAFHHSEALKDVTGTNFHIRWAEFRSSYARALLFLLSVSHIIILVHPKPRVELFYVQLFRVLDLFRPKFAPSLAEYVKDVLGINEDWFKYLRLCTPRMLFLFENCPFGLLQAKPSSEVTSIRVNQKTPTKKTEHAFEDHIYRVLRKSRILNASSNSLFAVPANQEYVYFQVQSCEKQDKISQQVNSLIGICNGTAKKKKEHFAMTAVPEHDFKSFLQQHVDMAFTKGFDDSFGRHAKPSHFELPTLSAWWKAVNKFYSFFLNEPADLKLKQLMSQFQSSFEVSIRFSESRSKKILPVATTAYQENLPSHYTKAYHEGRLAHAVSVFVQQARGPLCSKYIDQLQQECERHWKSGRQMCEVLSLTGNPCTNPLHKAIEEEEPCKEALNKYKDWRISSKEKDRAPTLPHSSGVRYVSACNCGRKQGPREDPFVLRTANCDFYAALAADCCEPLEHFSFPVFTPSVKDFKAARLFPACPEISGSRRESLRENTPGNITQGNTQQGLSLGAFFSGHSGGSQQGTDSKLCTSVGRNKDENNLPSSQQEIVIRVTDTEKETSKEKCLVRQPSTTEYLPGMPHTDSPLGLLPQFPSWSLTCLGPSSLYSHNHGLSDQPGFLPGTGYLLPWDVTVRVEPSVDNIDNSTKWPVLGESAVSPAQPRKQMNVKGRKSKIAQDQSEFVVKIFIGTEYECPRGHRFMCSAPDRILKATVSGTVQETGLKVAASDMPLYFPCPCRNAKPLIAQLMRLHVVTPKARVHVTLNPRVKPAPEPCSTFIPGLQEPIKLTQSAYWILRLPYIYVGEHGPFAPPKDHLNLNCGKLLSGTYGISNF